MRTIAMTIVVLSMAAGCASAAAPESPSRGAATGEQVTPVVRLMDITPADGSQVDTSTVIVAKLAYHIPDFDPDATYTISAAFARAEGGTFNRGGGGAALRSPAGIATVRHSLERLWSAGPSQPRTPLTGTFYLLEQSLPPVAGNPIEVGEGIQIRSSTTTSRVRARTRTFYFNGAGPARTLAVGLLDVLEEYWTYQPEKALAMAYAAPERWTYGYAYGHRSIDEAKERALEECRAAAQRREIDAPCRIIAMNEDSAEP